MESPEYIVVSESMKWCLKITGAACGKTSDSRTDGIRTAQLSFPTMSFHIDLFAIGHSKMTSDTYGFAVLFLTDYCKALPNA